MNLEKSICELKFKLNEKEESQQKFLIETSQIKNKLIEENRVRNIIILNN